MILVCYSICFYHCKIFLRAQQIFEENFELVQVDNTAVCICTGKNTQTQCTDGQVSRDAGLLGNVAGVRTSTCTSTYTTSMVDCAWVHRGDFCNMEVTVCLLSQSTLQNFVHGILCRKGLLTITGSFLVQPYLEK